MILLRFFRLVYDVWEGTRKEAWSVLAKYWRGVMKPAPWVNINGIEYWRSDLFLFAVACAAIAILIGLGAIAALVDLANWN